MKKKNKINWNDTPSNIISFRYASIAFIIVLILMLIIPKILNYGPGTINTEFDVQMSHISYNTQFFIIGLVVITGIVLFCVNIRNILLLNNNPFHLHIHP